MKPADNTLLDGRNVSCGEDRGLGKPAPLTGEAGFSLVELMVTIVIVAILASIAISSYAGIRQQVNQARSMEELRGIEQSISSYVIEKGVLPESLADLRPAPFLDPWGNPVIYVNIASGGVPRKDWAVNNLNSDYDLYSKGPDNLTHQMLSDSSSEDDVLRGADGSYMGLGINY